MPYKKCDRCGAWKPAASLTLLGHPLPAALVIEGTSQSATNGACSSCKRRVAEHFQRERERPGPSTRSAPLVPATSRAAPRPRVDEVDDLRASAPSLDDLESARKRSAPEHLQDYQTSSRRGRCSLAAAQNDVESSFGDMSKGSATKPTPMQMGPRLDEFDVMDAIRHDEMRATANAPRSGSTPSASAPSTPPPASRRTHAE